MLWRSPESVCTDVSIRRVIVVSNNLLEPELIEVGKLSDRTIMTLALLAFVVFSGVTGLTYVHNTPFFIYGQPFGFGSDELNKKTAALEDATRTINEIERQFDRVQSENVQLKEANAKLVAQQQARAREEVATWFPVDEVDFREDGRFTTEDGRHGKGVWSNQDSELTLRLMAIKLSGVILGTNLQAPGNKLRIEEGPGMVVPMPNYHYHVSIIGLDGSEGHASIRIERRPKQ